MLRKLLLLASRSKILQFIAMHFPLAKKFARRFVAGETLDEAIAVAKQLNEQGLMVSLDHLGESVLKKEEAEQACEDYLSLLDAIVKEELVANLSIKLTQLGLDIDPKLTEKLVRRIAKEAKKHDISVRIDMESSDYTQKTLSLYNKLHRIYPNLGVVIQSYLRRSEEDVKELVEKGASVRLCKGAYDEPKSVAFSEKKVVDHNLLYLAGMLFSKKALANGTYPCIATHDSRLIHVVKVESEKLGVEPEQFEFQMLYGIRPRMQKRLVKDGYRVRIYVPYGTAWYPYFMRRLAERPANLWFFLKSIFLR